MQRNTERDMPPNLQHLGWRPVTPMGVAHLCPTRDISSPAMSAKKTVVEVHKFGGASLGDGASFRHAVSIVKGRRAGAPVVVVSAPAGITDVLLGLATRAVAGDKRGRDGL